MIIHLAASASTVLHLSRVCPKCHRPQVVKLSQRYSEVTCKHCHARIPAAAAPAKR